ncbi:MAG: Smr/MutS family protein [Rhodobacteraceae bacterium]|nr:Smr/MutS family protein [Paracoccaceae bacterium]
MTRKGRRISAEDQALWGRVAQTARPLSSDLAGSELARQFADAMAEKPRGAAARAPSGPARSALPTGMILRPTPPARPDRGHDLAHSLDDALARQPVRMDKRQFQRLSRGKLEPDARIDLHGMTLAQAHGALNGFILRAHAGGARLVLVITGKGKSLSDDGPIPRRPGALRHDVPQWLRMAPLGPLVLEVRQAHARHGGSGAYYVYLRRMR